MSNSGFDKINLSLPDTIYKESKIDDPDNLSMPRQEAIRFKEDTRHRRILIKWMIIVVSSWLFLVLCITATNRVLNLGIGNNVLITLLATTTINVLGLSKIILSGLFKK